MTFNLPWHPTARAFRLRVHPVLTRCRKSPYLRFSHTNVTAFQHPSAQQTYVELTQKLYEVLKDCAAMKSILVLRKCHAHVVSLGLGASVFIQNNLVNAYAKCGSVRDAFDVFCEMGVRNVHSWNAMIDGFAASGMMGAAQKLFEEMPESERDTITWNSMMARYFDDGKPGETVKMFSFMLGDSYFSINSSSVSCALKACGSLGDLAFASQLHALIEKSCLREDDSVQGSIVDAYIKSGALSSAEKVFSGIANPSVFCWNSMIYCYSKLYGARDALHLFQSMPRRNGVSWNMVVSILSQHGMEFETLSTFVEMSVGGFKSTSETYASVLSSCATVCDIEWGAHLHARILRVEIGVDVFAGGGLIDMYWKCGHLGNAHKVFDSLSQHNAVSWTSFIRGLAHFGLEDKALESYNKMRSASVAPDHFTLSVILGTCSTRKDVWCGRQLHAQAIKLGMQASTAVGNAILTVYAKCGDSKDATRAFYWIPKKDTISWTLMIIAFSQIGDVETAREYFDRMPERNIVTWNSMLAAYIQNELWEESLRIYMRMLEVDVKPDWITLVTCMSACADLSLMSLGSQIIAQAEKIGLSCNVSVANSFVTFYSRCGDIDLGEEVFEAIDFKNLVSWNAMMSGFAHNGQGRRVVETFEEMLAVGCLPDNISFACVLSGCSHAGLLSEGKRYFESMTRDYNLSPNPEHYTCMVDLLGRAGLLEQALSLIKEMPFKPNADIWKALLSACRTHGSAESAEFAVKNLLEMDVEDSGSYILLAHVYWESGKSQGVAALRKSMRDKRMVKHNASSWIEVNNKIHVFAAHDSGHPQINDVYKVLEGIQMEIHGDRTSELWTTVC
uniref:Uncharacterized protein n=1 Tax=Kalanchoe fedtschenkoi TaxID=63787 RepID=A0A7N0UG53_KALFE